MKAALWMAINKRIDFTCTGAYAVLIMSGLKCMENRSIMSGSKNQCGVVLLLQERRYDGEKSFRVTECHRI